MRHWGINFEYPDKHVSHRPHMCQFLLTQLENEIVEVLQSVIGMEWLDLWAVFSDQSVLVLCDISQR
jgi:hypothetical protein